MSRFLPRSYSAQLLGYAGLLLLAMLTLATALSMLAARPSAEHMARTLAILAGVSGQELRLQPRLTPSLSEALIEAGVFPVLPAASKPARTVLPFPRALREILAQRLGREVNLVVLPDGETALWLPSNGPELLPFGLRFEPARGPLTRVGILVVISCALALLLATWWLARWLSLPLRRLSDALPGLAAGAALPDLGRHAPQEVQALARTLNDAISRLREQARAREQTLAGISHDLRTPLMRIALAAQLLPEHAHIADIQADVTEMDRMISEALELARAGRQEPAVEVELAPLLQRLLASSSALWAIDLDAPLCLRAPPVALRRALENLLQNAERHGAAPFAVRTERSSEGVNLVIADSGSGLGELAPEQATQAFRQGPQATQGSGLGLAIVERLAASFDAELRLETDDQGFRAVLAIPAKRIVERAQGTGPRAQGPESGR